ncbi:type II toxin-antitoxin system RelE/ParE family toxin [Candidatus Poribacteria bacterium]|nr:type II toxin-antitoxin system RelE/ParE family toxin [Candidatus Poribacteria bacterium]
MDHKYKIHYLPCAQKDLTEIIEYIKIDSPNEALDMLTKIDNAILKLKNFPFIGKIPKDNRLRYLNYRILIIDHYLVFYVIINNEVEIRRILHGKRDYMFLL